MLTERIRKIVERALGRQLTAAEDAGYPGLAHLPSDVVASAKIREASNLDVSVQLDQVARSLGLDLNAPLADSHVAILPLDVGERTARSAVTWREEGRNGPAFER